MKVSRRRFLIGAGGAAAIAAAGGGAYAVTASGSSGSGPSSGSGSSGPSSSSNGRALVILALYGGNDGLNTVIPYQDPAYLGGRPTLGFKPSEVIPLDKDLALNPALTGMKSLWDNHKLAIVRGVGYPDPNYSHFRSMDIWQSAAPASAVSSGWIGRWLDTLGDKDPLAALSIGPNLPKAFQGDATAGAAIPAGPLTIPNVGGFAKLMATYGGEPALSARVAQSGADLLTVAHTIGALAPTAAATDLESQLNLVANFIKGGLSTKVYFVSFGGFDTHSGERDTQQRLLGEVDKAVSTFVAAVTGHDVVLMTFSEFGRRVAENASGGTDHGSASPLFVAGPNVKGGYYGEQPSLTDLDDSNLKFTVDFRSVYATVLEKVVGVDSTGPLGGSFPTLGFA